MKMKTEKVSSMKAMASFSQQADTKDSAGKTNFKEFSDSEHEQNAAVFDNSTALEEQRQAELDGLWKMINESNYTIQQAAESLKPLYPDPCTVPSVLGLSVNAAMSRLKAVNLSIGRISQQHHPHVPAGHIIQQIPASGSIVSPWTGIQVLLSKGAPPERATRNTARKPASPVGITIHKEQYQDHMLRSGPLQVSTSYTPSSALSPKAADVAVSTSEIADSIRSVAEK